MAHRILRMCVPLSTVSLSCENKPRKAANLFLCATYTQYANMWGQQHHAWMLTVGICTTLCKLESNKIYVQNWYFNEQKNTHWRFLFFFYNYNLSQPPRTSWDMKGVSERPLQAFSYCKVVFSAFTLCLQLKWNVLFKNFSLSRLTASWSHRPGENRKGHLVPCEIHLSRQLR